MADKKKLMIWSIVGVFAVFLLAAGWHFLYSDVAKCGLTAAIAPVNESPWEHTKLFFMPAIIWYVVLYFIDGRAFPNFVFSHAAALLAMPVIMLSFYSIYSLFVEDTLALDIANAFVTIALGQLIAFKLTTSKLALSGAGYRTAAIVIVLALFAVFIVFTFYTPHCGVFFDRSQMKYGI